MAVRGKWIAAVALVATACSGGSGDGSGGGAGGAALPVLGAQPAYNLAKVELVSSVKAQGSCDALAERLRRLGDEHVGPYGFGWGGYYGPMPTSGRTVDEFAAVSDSVGGQASAATEKSLPLSEGGDGSFSGTNNQEAGVDEADTVKTDGKQVYLLRDNRLLVVDVSAGGAGAKVRGSLTFDDASPTSMLLADGVVMVFSQRYIDPSAPEVKQVKDRLWRMGAPRTQVAMVDVSNPDAPTVTDTVDIDGDLAAARMVGGRAHLAMRFTPLGLPFVVPQSQIGEDTARDMNRRIVRDAPLEQWLPHLWRDGKRSDLVDCDSVWIPDTFAGVQMTSIVSVPMGARVETSAVSLLAPGETVYASSTSMYVTAQAWFDQQTIGENSDEWPKPSEWKTAVHRFSIGDAQPGDGAGNGAELVLVGRGRQPPGGRDHHRFALEQHRRREVEEPADHAVDRRHDTGGTGVGDRPRCGRDHPERADHRQAGLSGDVPPDRPVLRGRPERRGSAQAGG